MSRYIDADAYAAEMKELQDACKEIMDAAKQDENWEVYDRMNTAFGVFVEAKLTLDAMPTVDAVPVVRCRECKYAHLTYDGDIKYCDLLAVKDEYGECDPCFYRSGDWFCADGERRTDEQQSKG